MNVRKTFWSDLTTTEFTDLDHDHTVAILPVAAFEQHGPHLSVATDTVIAEGMIKETLAHLPDDLSILVLPTQCVGKSNEHIRSPGTLTLSAETALHLWIDIGESVARAGIRKLVMVNSHGGNTDLLGVVARELRIRCQMLCVRTAWRQFGLPEGLYSAEEDAHGIHGGDIETSLMLYFRPDLVRLDRVGDFRSAGIAMALDYAYLRPTGPHGFGWIAQDLHPSGTVGNAAAATAEKGKLTAEHEAKGFLALLNDVARFPIDSLA